jgi:hypothetical protein
MFYRLNAGIFERRGREGFAEGAKGIPKIQFLRMLIS